MWNKQKCIYFFGLLKNDKFPKTTFHTSCFWTSFVFIFMTTYVQCGMVTLRNGSGDLDFSQGKILELHSVARIENPCIMRSNQERDI